MVEEEQVDGEQDGDAEEVGEGRGAEDRGATGMEKRNGKRRNGGWNGDVKVDEMTREWELDVHQDAVIHDTIFYEKVVNINFLKEVRS